MVSAVRPVAARTTSTRRLIVSGYLNALRDWANEHGQYRLARAAEAEPADPIVEAMAEALRRDDRSRVATLLAAFENEAEEGALAGEVCLICDGRIEPSGGGHGVGAGGITSRMGRCVGCGQPYERSASGLTGWRVFRSTD